MFFWVIVDFRKNWEELNTLDSSWQLMQFRKKIDSSGQKLQCIDSLKQEQLNILEMLRKKGKKSHQRFFFSSNYGWGRMAGSLGINLVTYLYVIYCLFRVISIEEFAGHSNKICML